MYFQARVSSVKGIVMRLQSPPEGGCGPLGASGSGGVLEEGSTPHSLCVYIETQHSSIWGQEQEAHHRFARYEVFTLDLNSYLHACIIPI